MQKATLRGSQLGRQTGSVFVNVPSPATPTYYQGWMAAGREIATSLTEQITAEQVFEKTIYTHICNTVWRNVLVTGAERSLKICSVRGVSDFAITHKLSENWLGSNKHILKRHGISMRKHKGRWYVHIPIKALFSQELQQLFAS